MKEEYEENSLTEEEIENGEQPEPEEEIEVEPEVEEDRASPPEDNYDEAHAERQPERRQRAPAHKRILEIERQRYQAEAIARKNAEELEKARKDVDHYKNMADLYNKSSMINFENSIEVNLERAKDRKRSAVENGDIEAQIEADMSIAKFTTEKHTAEAWKIQNKLQEDENSRKQKEHQENQSKGNNDQKQEYYNWIVSNPVLHPNSPYYSPEIVKRMEEYVDRLDTHLMRNNQSHLYRGNEYIRHLDEYKNQLINEYYSEPEEAEEEYYQPPVNRGVPVRNDNRGYVAPVNGRYVSPVNRASNARGVSSNKPKMTAAQAEAAKMFEVSNSAYMKHANSKNRVVTR